MAILKIDGQDWFKNQKMELSPWTSKMANARLKTFGFWWPYDENHSCSAANVKKIGPLIILDGQCWILLRSFG